MGGIQNSELKRRKGKLTGKLMSGTRGRVVRIGAEEAHRSVVEGRALVKKDFIQRGGSVVACLQHGPN